MDVMNDKKAGHSIYYPLLAVLFVFLFELSFFNRYFPLSEGWWETYGYLMNKGMAPYRDFFLVFPPVIPSLMAVFIKIFGLDFYTLRITGVLVHVVSVWLMFYWLSRFFSWKDSAIAAAMTIFLSISSPVFIAKDYHTFVDFALLGVLIFLSLAIRRTFARDKTDKKPSKTDLTEITLYAIVGVFCGTLLLIKQNIGLFAIFGVVVGILITPRIALTARLAKILSVAIGSLLSVVILAAAVGAWSSLSFADISVKNDSKGNIVTVLTRFAVDPNNRKFLVQSVLMLFAYYLYQVLRDAGVFTRAFSWAEKRLLPNVTFQYLVYAVILVLTVLYYFSVLSAVISLSIAILLIVTYKIYRPAPYGLSSMNPDQQYLPLVVLLIILAYTNTHTASFNSVGMAMPIAFSTAYLLHNCRGMEYARKWLITAIFVLLPGVVVVKWFSPYDWWGLKQPSILEAREALPYKEMKGIYVDDQTEKLFSVIKSSIEQYSLNDRDVFLYPSIPMFYALHEKLPPFKSVVQWFDVMTKKQGEAEINSLTNNPPRLIVFLNPPDFVYRGHAELKKDSLIQGEFRELFFKWIIDKEYRIVSTHVLDYSAEAKNRDLGKNESAVVMIVNPAMEGKNWRYLCGEKQCDALRTQIHSWKREGVEKSTDGGGVLQMGDVLEINAPNRASLNTIIETAGHTPTDTGQYVLYIMVRR